MRKFIFLLGAIILLGLPAYAQVSHRYSEIPLQLMDQGKNAPTLGDNPNFLYENRNLIQQSMHMLDKVERMPIAKGPADFFSNMPMKEVSDSLDYNMPILRERKDW